MEKIVIMAKPVAHRRSNQRRYLTDPVAIAMCRKRILKKWAEQLHFIVCSVLEKVAFASALGALFFGVSAIIAQFIFYAIAYGTVNM